MNLKRELKSVALVTAYFAAWIGALLGLKKLILAQYEIAFYGWSKALVGALVLAKVVLILDHAPLGAWVRSRPAWIEVALRSFLYAAGVLMVMLLEKAFEGRHEHGGLGASLQAIFQHVDLHHVWANTLALGGAILVYNAFAKLKEHLGPGTLRRAFLCSRDSSKPSERHEP